MEEPIVSVVLPIHGETLFLKECIESVLSQTLRNFELLCVCDDSVESGVVGELNLFRQNDVRVKVVNCSGRSLSVALNAGVSQACGEYLVFMDQDDIMLPSHLQSLERVIKETRSRAAIAIAGNVDVNGRLKGRMSFSKYLCCRMYRLDTVEEKGEFAETLYPRWLKCVERKLWIDNDIRFSEAIDCDIPIHLQLIAVLDRIACVNEITYLRRKRPVQSDEQEVHNDIDTYFSAYIETMKTAKTNANRSSVLRVIAQRMLDSVRIKGVGSRIRRFFVELRCVPLRILFRCLYHRYENRKSVKYRVLGIVFSRRKRDYRRYVSLPIPNLPLCGRYTYCATPLDIANKNEIEIGSFVSIGKNCRIGNGIHPQNYLSSSPYFYFSCLKRLSQEMKVHDEWWDLAPIKVGNDVWIGDDVYIMNGVTVGDGAIIGARSLVRNDVPPYAIVAGTPARIIRYRFPEDVIKRLLTVKWWELEDEILSSLPYDDIIQALGKLESIRQLR